MNPANVAKRLPRLANWAIGQRMEASLGISMAPMRARVSAKGISRIASSARPSEHLREVKDRPSGSRVKSTLRTP